MRYLKDLSDVSITQILAQGMNLKDVIREDFLQELTEKLGKDYNDIVASDLRLQLVPKQEEPELKEDEKGIIIQLRKADFIRFEQPSPDHYKEKIIVITSNRKGVLDKVLNDAKTRRRPSLD